MSRKKRILIIVLIFIILIIAAGIVTIKMLERSLGYLSQEIITEIDLSRVDNGIYAGEYIALPISVKVEAAVKDHQIIDIKLLEHHNGQGAKAETIIPLVLQQQSLQVDAVSGATYSSKVILKAIENALQKGLR